MSTNRTRIQEAVKTFTDENLVFGPGYWINKEHLKGDLDDYVKDTAYISDVNTISFLGEFLRMFPSVENEKRGYNYGLRGVAYKEMEGLSVDHFISARLEFGEDCRMSNEELRQAYYDFLGDQRVYKENPLYIKKQLMRTNKGVRLSAYREGGRTVRGLVGVGLRG